MDDLNEKEKPSFSFKFGQYDATLHFAYRLGWSAEELSIDLGNVVKIKRYDGYCEWVTAPTPEDEVLMALLGFSEEILLD